MNLTVEETGYVDTVARFASREMQEEEFLLLLLRHRCGGFDGLRPFPMTAFICRSGETIPVDKITSAAKRNIEESPIPDLRIDFLVACGHENELGPTLELLKRSGISNEYLTDALTELNAQRE